MSALYKALPGPTKWGDWGQVRGSSGLGVNDAVAGKKALGPGDE